MYHNALMPKPIKLDQQLKNQFLEAVGRQPGIGVCGSEETGAYPVEPIDAVRSGGDHRNPDVSLIPTASIEMRSIKIETGRRVTNRDTGNANGGGGTVATPNWSQPIIFRPCGPDRRGHRRVAPGAVAGFWFRR